MRMMMRSGQWFIGLILLSVFVSGCGLFSAPPTVTPIFVTATPAPTATPADTPTAADTSVFGPTAALAITLPSLPTATKTPLPTQAPTLTPSFTPEFTETLTPKPKPGTGTAVGILPGAGQPCGSAAVAAMPANGFTALYQRDRTLQAALGCPKSSPAAIGSAVESFDSGTLLWASALADQPRKVIYVLYSNGTYQRYDDTWTEGVDPGTTGENPPPGRKAPIRGFGKVWHNNAQVHGGLGWALNDEAGTSGQIQRFERGEMLFVASTNQIYIFASGAWRADPTKF